MTQLKGKALSYAIASELERRAYSYLTTSHSHLVCWPKDSDYDHARYEWLRRNREVVLLSPLHNGTCEVCK